MEHEKIACIYKALGEPTRLKIVLLLKEKGSMCACKLLERFSITQPTLSYHMKTLIDSGIVVSKRQGTWNHYSINTKMLKNALAFLALKEVVL